MTEKIHDPKPFYELHFYCYILVVGFFLFIIYINYSFALLLNKPLYANLADLVIMVILKDFTTTDSNYL